MKISVVGTGYVGLVTGTCFAETGNDVTCIDIDRDKIERLRNAEIPIYEPGLSELVERNSEVGRLQFTTDLASAVATAQLVFIAVGTPSGDDGAADLSNLWSVVDAIYPHLKSNAIVVIKSTVPVGTNAAVYARLRELSGRDCDVASNPEFLKEGAAIDDCMKPDRVVVGVRRAAVGDVLRDLYAPFLRTEKPFLVMSPESAEMTKYAANAMLATKISFINEMANFCEGLGADINDVRRGIGHDARIGFAFLFPGVGYGGSCFPKDVRALQSMAQKVDLEPRMLCAADAVNDAQKQVVARKLHDHFGEQLRGSTVAIWGLAFKPQTDDIREAPALALIDHLLDLDVRVQVHDPEAMENVRDFYGDILVYAEQPYDALEGADALAVMTEWKTFVHSDFARMHELMRQHVIVDGRNIYSPQRMREAGFHYYSIGRPPALPGD